MSRVRTTTHSTIRECHRRRRKSASVTPECSRTQQGGGHRRRARRQAADEHAWGRSHHRASFHGGGRRHQPLRERSSTHELSWTHRRRAELGANASTHRHHQSGAQCRPPRARARRVAALVTPTGGPDGAVGAAHRRAAQHANRHHRAGAQDGRRPVRDVARRSALSTATCRAADDVARSAPIIFCSSCPLSDCPKAVTAKAALWHSTSGSSDLVDANTACRWIFSCVIANANSRLRQADTGTGQQIQPIGASLGIALLRSALQLPPLHSRSLSQSRGPTRRPA